MAIRVIGHYVMYLPDRKKDERKTTQNIQNQEKKIKIEEQKKGVNENDKRTN